MELFTPLLKNNCNLEKYAADGFHISLIWTKNLTSCKTVSTIIKLGFEVLEHPAYSPDLAPSDYFLFGLLKKELKGKKWCKIFFHTLPKSAYKESIYKLPERWRRCIESQACQKDLFDCRSSNNQRTKCIPMEWTCDDNRDCDYGTDEKLELCLSRINCSNEEFKCKIGQCIPLKDVCNGIHNCIDTSDENCYG
ncbi:hypothetical protein LAZ67_5003286 [Cordylochernes scorpioides]|uniref:Uncharacterized protein n=1 Tax=Cordylochernes scorpioides TaxID=51811 RepID=A0ABY6KHV6_9ARAC|nr:hypothetical protein LAZ67_5003286 [Cordylochernes scorpioides]